VKLHRTKLCGFEIRAPNLLGLDYEDILRGKFEGAEVEV
jgi:hypothetical protein